MTFKPTIIKIKPNHKQSANSYFFSYKNKNNMVDAGFFDFEKITETLNDKSGEIHNLFITHGHYDHIAGMEKIIEAHPNITIYIHEEERIFLDKSEYNLSGHFAKNFSLNAKYINNIKTFKTGDIIDGIKIIHTPGHTVGCSCFYIEEHNICLTGDTLFATTHGRTDLVTGNSEAMKKSLANLFELPPETMIYPGHARSEKLCNIKFEF
ncbi:MAG: MBL fold metallo-hydrolase [Candidatus Gracilibacteria bacterium]|nr:MBL fold metallo-hydrolase [Candidatus Gracilibacteria bacterium]